MNLLQGKPVRKERQSVPIAVRRLRTTQQQAARSFSKVRKTAVKRTPTEQILLGRFFDSAKNNSRTKQTLRTSRTRGAKSERHQGGVTTTTKGLANDRPNASFVPDGAAPSCVQSIAKEVHQIDAVGVLAGELHANGRTELPRIC